MKNPLSIPELPIGPGQEEEVSDNPWAAPRVKASRKEKSQRKAEKKTNEEVLIDSTKWTHMGAAPQVMNKLDVNVKQKELVTQAFALVDQTQKVLEEEKELIEANLPKEDGNAGWGTWGGLDSLEPQRTKITPKKLTLTEIRKD